MREIEIPAGGWRPRHYQQQAWDYLTQGGSDNKHAELIWHRRAGKDEICLHFAAREMCLRPATYWHMLPLKEQVRKAIWLSVNPHSGKRRIEEAFPREVFDYNESDMMVKCKINGATWQCLGSDNFNSAVGSPPRGITYSEWALANPSARGYLRPIIAENQGWQLFITTPRGKNHAYATYSAALKNMREGGRQFAQKLSVHDTGVLSPERLREELMEYVSTYGEAMGLALYEQEYECSFDAAILGAYYGSELKRIDQQGRITDVPHDPKWPVHVAFDIGYDDDTAIWFFQVIGGELRILEYYANSGKDPDHYCSQLLGKHVSIDIVEGKLRVSYGGDISGLEHRQAYRYGSLNLPHDAEAQTFAAKGKSVHEQFAAVFGWGKVQIVPGLSISDGIQASRKALNRAVFDHKCEEGISALREYQREWDDDRKMFKDRPLHNWTSHGADSFRYLAVAWTEDKLPREQEPEKWPLDQTINDMLKAVRKRRVGED